jgi:hypothetical protein
LATGAAALAISGAAIAAQPWGPFEGPRDLLIQVAHNHHHKSGHDMLGEKLHHEGRHEVDKLKGRSVVAEVRHGKVEKMDAQDLKMKRVKADHKMAGLEGGILRAAYSPMQLAQVEAYYGYCFDDGVEYNCYWYPADDVNVADYTWDTYDPTY